MLDMSAVEKVACVAPVKLLSASLSAEPLVLMMLASTEAAPDSSEVELPEFGGEARGRAGAWPIGIVVHRREPLGQLLELGRVLQVGDRHELRERLRLQVGGGRGREPHDRRGDLQEILYQPEFRIQK